MTRTSRTSGRPATVRCATLLGAALAFAAVSAPPAEADAQHRGSRARRHRRGHSSGRAAQQSAPQADMVFDAPVDEPGATAASASAPTGAGGGDAAARNAAALAGGTQPRPAAIDATIGIRAFRRHLSYHQDLFREFRPYDVDVAPAVFASAEWYPGAHFTAGWLANFGIVAAAESAFGLSSRDSANRAYNTTSVGYSGGVRGRVVVGPADLGVVLGYGVQSFVVDVPRVMGDTGVPGVTYQYLRFGSSSRVNLGERFALFGSFSYLHVLAAGEIQQVFFPRATAGAVEGSLGLAVALWGGLEVRAAFDARRYFFAMNPQPGDTYVVGGALDHYLAASLGVAFRR